MLIYCSCVDADYFTICIDNVCWQSVRVDKVCWQSVVLTKCMCWQSVLTMCSVDKVYMLTKCVDKVCWQYVLTKCTCWQRVLTKCVDNVLTKCSVDKVYVLTICVLTAHARCESGTSLVNGFLSHMLLNNKQIKYCKCVIMTSAASLWHIMYTCIRSQTQLTM